MNRPNRETPSGLAEPRRLPPISDVRTTEKGQGGSSDLKGIRADLCPIPGTFGLWIGYRVPNDSSTTSRKALEAHDR